MIIENKKIAIAGGSGFIGRRLARKLRELGAELILLSRNGQMPERASGLYSICYSYEEMSDNISSIDILINLAGANLSEKRWNKEFKKEIRDSRINTTKRLVELINGAENKPNLFVSASAIGFYGDRGEELLYEESKPGKDFLANVCKDWESSAKKVSDEVRLVIPRIAFVLDKNESGLAKIISTYKRNMGGRLASGKQWMTWVHIDELIDMFIHVILDDEIKDEVNFVSSKPCRNSEFSRVLARQLNKKEVMPVPKFALKLALGEFAEVLLSSNNIDAKKLKDSRFSFKFANIEEALIDILK